MRAPVDGTIGDLAPLRAGAYVAEGQKIASVVPGGGLVIVADFAPASVFGRICPDSPRACGSTAFRGRSSDPSKHA